jgi:hypothetical protein
MLWRCPSVEHIQEEGDPNTVRNEFEFPGDLSVGLPTLVQNPPILSSSWHLNKQKIQSQKLNNKVAQKG